MEKTTQEKVIQNTKRPITKKDIVKGLKSLGLKKDSLIEVHTSLSSFGYIINKEYDIIDALLDIVTEGVIIMPAHTGEYSDPLYWENPPVPKEWIEAIKTYRKPFDQTLYVPERIGKTPIAFFRYPEVKRTNHPSESLFVYNKTDDESWLDHSLNQDDDQHPLYKLASEGGQILFLGTTFQTCTSIHLNEKYSPHKELRVQKVTMVEDNHQIEKEVRSYVLHDDIDHFEEIASRYIESYAGTPHFKQVKIGLATCILIDAGELYDIGYDFLSNKKITSD